MLSIVTLELCSWIQVLKSLQLKMYFLHVNTLSEMEEGELVCLTHCSGMGQRVEEDIPHVSIF